MADQRDCRICSYRLAHYRQMDTLRYVTVALVSVSFIAFIILDTWTAFELNGNWVAMYLGLCAFTAGAFGFSVKWQPRSNGGSK